MQQTGHTILEGEILGRDAPDPMARDATPGWLTRHRDAIIEGRAMILALSAAAPPPLRVALAAASVATDGLILAEDWRRGALDGPAVRKRLGRIVLEGAAVLAATRFAPAVLARHRAHLAAAGAALRPAS